MQMPKNQWQQQLTPFYSSFVPTHREYEVLTYYDIPC